jgi:hypothetical protein
MVASLKLLPVRSCIIDGEAIVCDENGLAVFELIRSRASKMSAVLCAFDLLELDGRDLRRRPIEERKGLLAELLHDSDSDLGIVLNNHYEEDGPIVFREACRLGCEGIVRSTRLTVRHDTVCPMTPFVLWANPVAETRETILASQDHLARIRYGLVRTKNAIAQSRALLGLPTELTPIAAQQVVLRQFKIS